MYLKTSGLSYFVYIDFHKYSDKSNMKSKVKGFQMKLTILNDQV